MEPAVTLCLQTFYKGDSFADCRAEVARNCFSKTKTNARKKLAGMRMVSCVSLTVVDHCAGVVRTMIYKHFTRVIAHMIYKACSEKQAAPKFR